MEAEKLETIVFFDGYCGLCSGVVDYMVVRDRDRKLLYSPLQGETARTLLTDSEREDLDTVIVVERSGADVRKFKKSDAILNAIAKINPDLRDLAKGAQIFPKAVRDFVYDLIARNRFRLYPRRDFCRAPTAEERKLFLP